MISETMRPFIKGGSAIRAMFEEGKRMAKERGAENVFDFSIGNPGLKPPQEVYDAIANMTAFTIDSVNVRISDVVRDRDALRSKKLH